MIAHAVQVRHWLPGAALAGVIALAATFVSTLHGGPQLLYALFFGVAFHYLSREPTTKPGVEFCSRTVLRFGVGLLGARITGEQIASLGWATAGLVIAAVLTTLACGVLLARRLGMTRSQGVLSGGSVAICGASAALAIAAVLPKEKDGDRFTLLVVVTVTALSTLAMVIYPLVARLLHLDPRWAGLYLGGTIHDVAQVVGAGYTLGPEAGDFATIVKLFRVALLAVVVVAVSAAFRRERRDSPPGRTIARQPLVPWFLWMLPRRRDRGTRHEDQLRAARARGLAALRTDPRRDALAGAAGAGSHPLHALIVMFIPPARPAGRAISAARSTA